VLSIRQLDELITRVPDYPSPGIVFQDISPLLAHPEGLSSVTEHLCAIFWEDRISHVIGIESRGFLLGAPIAIALNAGLVLARKQGKLPRSTYEQSYDLEYGQATLEIHRDAFPENSRVLIVDDVLATGGTIDAVLKIVEKMQGKAVGVAILSEITSLNGRSKFAKLKIQSLIT
jgi:adenine phosphoribosyltransferase